MDLTPFKNCLALKNSIFIANEVKPYRPCCWFKTDIDATDIDDYRNQLANIDIEKNCDYCIQQEKGGAYSYRQHFVDIDDTVIITASFDNICNLKCITCTPNNSTQILAERFKFENKADAEFNRKYILENISNQAPKKIDFIKLLLAKTEFKKLRFSILGGEPLINPAIFEFLDWLVEQPYAKQTTITITTNGTTYNEKLLRYINVFERINVQLSIDGIEEEFEYLRFGASFETLKKVCDSFYDLTKKYDNFYMGCHYTLSWMNCLDFYKFFNWMQTNYPNVSDIYISKLRDPEPFSIDLLALDMRTKIYSDVISKMDTSKSQTYEKTLFLYKEHMLNTTHDVFDLEKFNLGVQLLNVHDFRRGNNHMIVVKDFMKFMNFDFDKLVTKRWKNKNDR